MLARVYLDGFNLFYGALKGTEYKWTPRAEFDFHALLRALTFMTSQYRDTLRTHTYRRAGLPMSAYPDLAVYDRHRQLTAIVEIKNKLGTTTDWAARTRRNILAHGSSITADFFLLVTRDRLYMWTENGGASDTPPPQYVGDTQSQFLPYFRGARVDPDDVSGSAFELLVSAWLSDLTRSRETDECYEHPEWLSDSGLVSAIAGGRVKHQLGP